MNNYTLDDVHKANFANISKMVMTIEVMIEKQAEILAKLNNTTPEEELQKIESLYSEKAKIFKNEFFGEKD